MAPMPTIAQLEKLLLTDPNDPFLHYGLGQEYAKSNDHVKAINSYSKVIELDSDCCYGYAYYFMGISLHALERFDEAIQTVKNGVSVAKKSNDAHAVSELSDLLQSME